MIIQVAKMYSIANIIMHWDVHPGKIVHMLVALSMYIGFMTGLQCKRNATKTEAGQNRIPILTLKDLPQHLFISAQIVCLCVCVHLFRFFSTMRRDRLNFSSSHIFLSACTLRAFKHYYNYVHVNIAIVMMMYSYEKCMQSCIGPLVLTKK